VLGFPHGIEVEAEGAMVVVVLEARGAVAISGLFELVKGVWLAVEDKADEGVVGRGDFMIEVARDILVMTVYPQFRIIIFVRGR